ncbi:Peptidase C39 family protein [Spirosomataceae bacterium TFI 002]|nr:Peptidase C39 family protein [Spirosomataceae bacterium TFI 002]
MKSNIAITFVRFLKELDANVTKTSAMDYIESHPEQGSLLSISEGLEQYNIETAAIRITEEQLVEMPTPFITFFKRNGGTFGVVKSYKDGMLEWFDTNKGMVSQAWSEFQQDWSGVVLLAETNEISGEKDYKQKTNQEFLSNSRVPLGLSLTAIVFLGFWFLNPSDFGFYANALLLLKATGAVLSALLLAKSANTDNEFVNKLCNVGSKVSCQSILDSPAAKLTSWLSLSDIGFIYFFASLISILMLGNDLSTFLTYHAVTSGLALAFGAYSIYYQGKIAKMWCPLCLGVVGVLTLEAVIVFALFEPLFSLKQSYALATLVSLTIPIAFLLLYKNELTKAAERDGLKNELSRLKANTKIIEALMASQKVMPFLPKGIGMVSIGNKDAEHVLTVVSNPLCNPCAKMHQRIEKVLEKTDNLRCDIVFTTNHDDIDIGGKVVRKILSLPTLMQEEAISEWYNSNNRNFNDWNKKYLNVEEKEVAELFRREQKQWNDDAEIKSTPTLFYDGKKLPMIIKVEDLEFAATIKAKATLS